MLGWLLARLRSGGTPAAPATLCGRTVREWERALVRLGLSRREAQRVITLALRPLARGDAAMTPAEHAELQALARQIWEADAP